MEQFAADAATAKARPHGQHTHNTVAGIEGGLVGVGSEAAMNETDRLAVVEGEDQTVRVEVGFGEEVLIQGGRRGQDDGPAPAERLVPDLDQTGRIVIPKGAVMNHELQPLGRNRHPATMPPL